MGIESEGQGGRLTGNQIARAYQAIVEQKRQQAAAQKEQEQTERDAASHAAQDAKIERMEADEAYGAYRAGSARIRAGANEMADEKRLDYHDPQPPKPAPSAAAWASFRAQEQASASLPPKEQPKPWWQRVKDWGQQHIVQPVQQTTNKVVNWVDAHQPAASIGVGAVVGAIAIGVTLLAVGTVTLPVLAVAAGVAAVAAGVTVAAGTMGLNAHFNRPITTNIWNNVKAAAITAAAVTGVGLFVAGGLMTQATVAIGNAIAGTCAANPAVCANAGAVLNVVDKLEEVALNVQLAVETATHNPHAGETAIELQLEYLDGGAPGNTVAAELGERLAKLGDDAPKLVAKYGDEIVPLLLQYGDDAVEFAGKYGDDGLRFLSKNSLTPDEISALANLPQETVQLADDIVNKIGVDYKNSPLRMEYESKVAGLQEELQEILRRNNGVVTEADAKALFEARRNLGVEYKNMTPGPLRDYIYELNSARYAGDPLGPDWNWLMGRYGNNYLKIATAATRPNKDVNNLLSGFHNWLKQKDTEYLLNAELKILRGE